MTMPNYQLLNPRLPQQAQGESEESRLRRELSEVQAKLDRVQKARTTNIRISEKGAVSVYGLGKFPITLYCDQWRMLLAQAEMIEQFLTDNAAKLAKKEG
jgi:hypothetical protein